MSEYQETIKNMERIRSYMRDFFIYGFKTRSDFSSRSKRTYDNEKRRIENWLADYITWDYSAKGKSVCIGVDSALVACNPLFVAWKCKSFTSNDIALHFFVLDILSSHCAYSAPEMTDIIARRYNALFDLQTVRGKLREYEEEGILCSSKDGRTLKYALSSIYLEQLPFYERLLDAVAFFSETAIGGYIGSTILDKCQSYRSPFCFKHHFIAHTLDDAVTLQLLELARQKRACQVDSISRRSSNEYRAFGAVMRVVTSVQTGRRYVTLYNERTRRFFNLRIDGIQKIKPLGVCENCEELSDALSRNTLRQWGVSFDGSQRLETLCVRLHIDEEKEQFILRRIEREGRGGELLHVDKDTYVYTVEVFDANEVMPWIKTFTGRIISIECNNRVVLERFYGDMRALREMYLGEGE